MSSVSKDDLLRVSVQGTFDEFVVAAKDHFEKNPIVQNYSETQFRDLQRRWADWVDNPYKKGAKPVPPPLKKFMVTFSRIGSDPDWQGWRTIVQAPELAAVVGPLKAVVDGIFEDEYDVPAANIPVTLIDDKGQLNYGLLGEFTVVEMPS